mmetsp:Transcript_11413/g.20616  ORF Transcript_11413/g.20616 Transcript_11413/m.20616 type:complete len:299 (-) Transcript_11413:354-1250(-)|eukprot:CAMPEP_0175077314 /NCGR_PEP_ID=MMETSP0052_2-20121109/23316_1 /TAXON_ID=51329 ORGANISM="Polytomella parva, Strain SAG 63-3" /NCGR_SAMPLE_ID=MMETSP0052_2 /ASSEMBLY_ACC=CAM_ASM_000194 /LENGTH=298 /DNA_ID=CAMNT_0016346755 /DNA_START=156 /DNA_END=1052 /DNA_ORIENTATION=-
MPKRTYQLNSSLNIGDPELGTGAWMTEYDIEFSTRANKDLEVQSIGLSRPHLRTPRSLKKGYVFYKDYENLEGQYVSAVNAYQELRQQLFSAEQSVEDMRHHEENLMTSVSLEHETVEDVKQQIERLALSVGKLLDSVDTSRAISQQPGQDSHSKRLVDFHGGRGGGGGMMDDDNGSTEMSMGPRPRAGTSARRRGPDKRGSLQGSVGGLGGLASLGGPNGGGGGGPTATVGASRRGGGGGGTGSITGGSTSAGAPVGGAKRSGFSGGLGRSGGIGGGFAPDMSLGSSQGSKSNRHQG